MGNARSKFSPLRWIIAAVVVLIAGVLTALVVMVNVAQSDAIKESRLPRIPFTSVYFLPDAAFISNLPMDAGMIVLVDKRTSYPSGCDVLIPDPNNHAELLVGRVEQADETTANLKIYNTNVTDITVQPDEILGKMDTGVIGVGFLYMAMLGFNGYIIFGLCPMLIGAIILVMMFKPGVLHRKSKVPDATNMRDNGIEVIEIEVIPTTIPPEYCNEAQQAAPSMGISLGESHEYMERSSEAATMIVHDNEVPADANDDLGEPAVLPVVDGPVDPIVPITFKTEQVSELVEEPVLSFPQDMPTLSELASFANQEEPIDLEKITRRAHLLDFGDIPVEESKAKLRVEPLPGCEMPPLPTVMDADEILRLYRLSKHTETMRTKASEEELLIMAKLYYEGNIDNYSFDQQ